MTLYKKKFGWNNRTCVNSNYVGKNIISLPLFPTLKDKEINYVCKKVCEFFED